MARRRQLGGSGCAAGPRGLPTPTVRCTCRSREAVITSRIRINELLANEDLDRRFQVRDTVITIDEALQWDVLSYETRTANAELLIADRDNTISELDLQSIRSRNYPYLNLTAGYGYTHNRYGSGTSRLRSSSG